jgi:hypothetical protein
VVSTLLLDAEIRHSCLNSGWVPIFIGTYPPAVGEILFGCVLYILVTHTLNKVSLSVKSPNKNQSPKLSEKFECWVFLGFGCS